jgi:hypothetical protein
MSEGFCIFFTFYSLLQICTELSDKSVGESVYAMTKSVGESVDAMPRKKCS